jgi:predicted N-acetyltransferase YhbS
VTSPPTPHTAQTPQTVIRPLTDADVPAVEQLAWDALAGAGRRYGFSMGERDEPRIAFAQARVRHLASTDPDGAFVAEQAGEPVGLAIALRRGSLWFLSLLTVVEGRQGGGIGRQLLDAALQTGVDAEHAMICASPDPKALRRYGRAGFALHPDFDATGRPDRTAIPTDLGVRDGDWDADLELVESLLTARRGAPYGPDLAWLRGQGMGLLVRDGATPGDRAVAIVNDGFIGPVAGASTDAATRVLWAALGAAPPERETRLGYLIGPQQWAVEVALAARLPFSTGGALCTRGYDTPPAPYLPSGIFG